MLTAVWQANINHNFSLHEEPPTKYEEPKIPKKRSASPVSGPDNFPAATPTATYTAVPDSSHTATWKVDLENSYALYKGTLKKYSGPKLLDDGVLLWSG